MARKLHHIEIYVSDLEVSACFWGWLLEELGYAPYQKWENGASWIDDGGEYICFVQAEARFLDIPYHRCRVGLNHLAFWGNSRGHIDEMTEKLKKRGANILYPERHPFAGGGDYYGVFFEDPDRIKVEIVAPRD